MELSRRDVGEGGHAARGPPDRDLIGPLRAAEAERLDQRRPGLVAGTGVIIDRGGGTSGPQFFAQGNGSINQIGYYQSTYGQVDVRISARVATGHVFMGKSYGQLDIRNPLAVRVHPQRGFGMAVVPETTNDIEFPIKQLDVDFEFGVGVGPDRTNGVHGFLVAGGTYADSAIT